MNSNERYINKMKRENDEIETKRELVKRLEHWKLKLIRGYRGQIMLREGTKGCDWRKGDKTSEIRELKKIGT